MDIVELIGIAAAFCTTIAYLPQVVRAWRTRSTKDVSLRMYIIMVTGTCLWLFYGLLIGNLPLIGANIASLVLTGSVLLLKLRYG